jgi:hypothetical protein
MALEESSVMARISADTAKCAGQAPDGSNKCGYRETCLRYVAPANERQVWAELWKAGDDCPHYLSIPKVAE